MKATYKYTVTQSMQRINDSEQRRNTSLDNKQHAKLASSSGIRLLGNTIVQAKQSSGDRSPAWLRLLSSH